MISILTLTAALGFGAPDLAESDTFGNSLKKIMARYERIRGELARDDGSRISAEARLLDEEAGKAATEGPSQFKERLLGMATAAKGLSEEKSESLISLRSHFGELSKHVIELLRRAPSLRDSLHLFSCPMVPQGKFGRWVQASSELENPYLGSRMLRCGTKVEWGK